jgi:hypothetical protein
LQSWGILMRILLCCVSTPPLFPIWLVLKVIEPEHATPLSLTRATPWGGLFIWKPNLYEWIIMKLNLLYMRSYKEK